MGSLDRHRSEGLDKAPVAFTLLETLVLCGNSLSRIKGILHTSRYSRSVAQEQAPLPVPGSLEPCFGWYLIWMTLLKAGQPDPPLLVTVLRFLESPLRLYFI